VIAKVAEQRVIPLSAALVEVLFTPHPDDIELLAKEGVRWEPIPHRMMFDTGAENTVVEDAVPKFLHLEPIRYQAIAGVTGDPDCPVYRLEITIGANASDDDRGKAKELRFSADIFAVPPVAEFARPHVGLLGRDLLQLVRFEYDGPAGAYRLIDEHPPLDAP
jgi:hypothetical protein